MRHSAIANIAFVIICHPGVDAVCGVAESIRTKLMYTHTTHTKVQRFLFSSSRPSEIYTLPCVKQIASGKLLYNTGNSAWYFVTTKRGGMEGLGGRLQREGIYVYLWWIHIVVGQKPTQHSKQLSSN